ncbi:hypothetical protein CISIN_1g021860mg [Citrus sinensis]|uniref:NusB/RsmB/TIM44 domain-containing protein n=1 Tax=Citrus sinensis TaxID=2711 RepID=A0A067EHE1_CITSI|nr:hypothetical protein CISIN_1g021860mg [Citrus sinensis]
MAVEATSSFLSCSSKTHFLFNLRASSSPSSWKKFTQSANFAAKNRHVCRNERPNVSCSAAAFAVQETLEKTRESVMASSAKEMMPKIDKSGRLVVYAACLEGSDPIRLFEKRLNSRREPGYEFDKSSLLEYNHMSFGGPPVTTETVEEADELLRSDEEESAIEAEVLSAPPKLVYSKLLLRFTRKLLVAVVDKWDAHVHIIDKVVPPIWKDQPAGRILELSILHLAMSEITVVGTRHQIVINEAVDLAKRFCDGAAPRIINGCLRTFVRNLEGTANIEASKASKEVPSEV